MTKAFLLEQWKPVLFPFACTNQMRLEVSNFGRIQSFTKEHPNGHILKGSITNGYSIVRLKLYKPRLEKTATEMASLKAQVDNLTKQLKLLKQQQQTNTIIEEQLADILKKYKKVQKRDIKERTVNFHALIHRLVAENFLPAPTHNQTLVAHLDYNKQNNKVHNLCWMTQEENYKHQQNSPYVIEDKAARKEKRFGAKPSKLTVTKVMFLKKLLGEGKPIKGLVKQFKITETQILRIKRGENWGDIPAAQ